MKKIFFLFFALLSFGAMAAGQNTIQLSQEELSCSKSDSCSDKEKIGKVVTAFDTAVADIDALCKKTVVSLIFATGDRASEQKVMRDSCGGKFSPASTQDILQLAMRLMDLQNYIESVAPMKMSVLKGSADSYSVRDAKAIQAGIEAATPLSVKAKASFEAYEDALKAYRESK